MSDKIMFRDPGIEGPFKDIAGMNFYACNCHAEGQCLAVLQRDKRDNRETAVACWSELGQRPMKTQHIFFQHIGVQDPVVENPVVISWNT